MQYVCQDSKPYTWGLQHINQRSYTYIHQRYYFQINDVHRWLYGIIPTFQSSEVSIAILLSISGVNSPYQHKMMREFTLCQHCAALPIYTDSFPPVAHKSPCNYDKHTKENKLLASNIGLHFTDQEIWSSSVIEFCPVYEVQGQTTLKY
jgi:hypothetical protein